MGAGQCPIQFIALSDLLVQTVSLGRIQALELKMISISKKKNFILLDFQPNNFKGPASKCNGYELQGSGSPCLWKRRVMTFGSFPFTISFLNTCFGSEGLGSPQSPKVFPQSSIRATSEDCL